MFPDFAKRENIGTGWIEKQASFSARVGATQVLRERALVEPRVTKAYDRYSYDKDKRDGLEAWSKRLMLMVSDPKEVLAGPARIVPTHDPEVAGSQPAPLHMRNAGQRRVPRDIRSPPLIIVPPWCVQNPFMR